MKTTFEKELKGKEKICDNGIFFASDGYYKVDVIKAKNKAKKEILEEIDKLVEITPLDKETKKEAKKKISMNDALNGVKITIRRYNELAKKIVEEKL